MSLAGFGLVAGCAKTDPATGEDALTATATPDSAEWSDFGPYLKPEASDEADWLPGPTKIKTDEGVVVNLDAESLLATTEVLTLQVPHGELLSQAFSYTYSDGDPYLAGLITRRIPATQKTPELFQSNVVGVSLGEDGKHPEIVTNVRVFSGEPHDIEFAATSDQGVVALQFDGGVERGVEYDPQIIGIDPVRGTWVWSNSDEYSVSSGVNEATAADVPSDEACPDVVRTYDVATGATIDEHEPTAAELDNCA